jgi:hypothetical protein
MIVRKLSLPGWVPSPRRELRFGSRLVKRLARPAKNQELILAAFQELGWPEYMENPITGPRKTAHERLRDVIKKLNRGQNILRFHADGTGDGIRWQVVRRIRKRADRTHFAPRPGG